MGVVAVVVVGMAVVVVGGVVGYQMRQMGEMQGVVVGLWSWW